jgi:hypothetical protein
MLGTPPTWLDSDVLSDAVVFFFTLTLTTKIPTLNSLQSKQEAGASRYDLFVGNATAHSWTSIVIQHYYVSNIIYGLIQCQFYNCIIAIYLHLEKNKSQ